MDSPRSDEAQLAAIETMAGERRWPDVKAALEAAGWRGPLQPSFCLRVGALHLRMGDVSTALDHLERAAGGEPHNAQALTAYGVALRAIGRVGESVYWHTRALQISPQSWEILTNRGMALREVGAWGQAESDFRMACRMAPGTPECWLNLGNVLRDRGLSDAALTAYRRALSLAPSMAVAHRSLALAMSEAGELERAVPIFETAHRLGDARARATMGTMLLREGRMRAGWEAFEFRTGMGDADRLNVLRLRDAVADARRARHPILPMTASSRARVLVVGEAGLGDTIQMARFVIDLSRLGFEVTLAVQRGLSHLFQGLAPSVIVRGDRLDAKPDFTVPVMSLPFVLGIDSADQIPGSRYLRVSPDRVQVWRDRVQGLVGSSAPRKPLIALAWSGSGNPGLPNRSIELEALRPMLHRIDARWISLQRDCREVDRRALRNLCSAGVMLHFSSGHDDLADAGALCVIADLVVTVDTCFAHLAGALGRPSVVVLPNRSDWRWFRAPENTPWYDAVQLVRSPELDIHSAVSHLERAVRWRLLDLGT